MALERKGDGNLAKDTEINGERNVLTTAEIKKIANDLMPMFFLNETIGQLAIENSVHWYDHVLRKDCEILSKALDVEVEGQRGKETKKDMKEVGRGGKHDGWCERGCTLYCSKWIVGVNQIATGLR